MTHCPLSYRSGAGMFATSVFITQHTAKLTFTSGVFDPVQQIRRSVCMYSVHVCVCVCACEHACVRACVCACVGERGRFLTSCFFSTAVRSCRNLNWLVTPSLSRSANIKGRSANLKLWLSSQLQLSIFFSQISWL